MNLQLLSYDIPENSEFPNPAGYLRSRALHFQYSVWIVDDSRIPYELLDDMTAAGVTWDLIPQSSKAVAKLIEVATRRLVEEMAKNNLSREKSLRNAEEKLAAVENNPEASAEEVEAARKAFQYARNALIKRHEERINDMGKAVEAFNLDVSGEAWAVVRERLQAIRQGARAEVVERAAAYADASRQVRGSEVESAARDGVLPALVLADVVEERGGNADTLRATFAPEVVEEDANDNRETRTNAPKLTLSTAGMKWNVALRRLSVARGEVSGELPRQLAVRSHKTGSVLLFSREEPGDAWEGGEYLYSHESGVTLTLV